MKKIMYVICFAGIVVQSCNHPQPVTDNPFLIPFDTPFEVPPFDKIQNRHYLPAFREGIKEQEAEIQAILKNPEAPTFANTVEAMEKSGQYLMCFSISGKPIRTIRSMPLQRRLCPKSRLIRTV